jgi:hypothetical protein
MRFRLDGKAVLYTSDLTAYSNMYLVEVGEFDQLPDPEYRRDHFHRANKQDMLECIMRLKNPEQAKENVFRASELVYVSDLERVRKSPFTY